MRIKRGANEGQRGDALRSLDRDVSGDLAPKRIADEMTLMDPSHRHPGDHPVGELRDGQHFTWTFAAAKTRKIQCINLVLARDAFSQRNHVEAGNDQSMNQHERNALSFRSFGLPAVELSSVHRRPMAFQKRLRGNTEVSKEFRKHQRVMMHTLLHAFERGVRRRHKHERPHRRWTIRRPWSSRSAAFPTDHTTTNASSENQQKLSSQVDQSSRAGHFPAHVHDLLSA